MCLARGTTVYEMITKYYEDDPSVTVYQKNDDCDSEDEIDEVEA